MTKEDILTKTLNDRCKYESSKEMDYSTHLAIMDAMEEYANQQVATHNENIQLPNNMVIYRQARKLDYAEFCKWINAKLGTIR